MHFWRFAPEHARLGVELQGTYTPSLVVLSVVIAIAGAFAMLRALDRFASADTPALKRVWLTSAALAMGFGIWAMHFTGMVALVLPVPIAYGVWLTVLSVVPAVLGSLAAAYVIGSVRRGAGLVVGAATLLAVGIGAMHYLGMEAIRLDGAFHHDVGLFLLSLATAFVLASLALFAHRSLTDRDSAVHRLARMPVSATLLGLAVAGMHYTAMASTQFYGVSTAGGAAAIASPFVITGVIAGMALILGTIYLGSLFDIRFAAISEALRRSEARNRAIVESMIDAQFLIDAEESILSANAAAISMFRHSAEELIGKNVRVLTAGTDDAPSGSWLDEHLASVDDRAPSHRRRGHSARRKDGEVFPIELLVTEFWIDRDRFFGVVIRDLSEFAATMAHTQRLLAAVEQAPDTIIILDRNMRVQYANPALTASSGYRPEALVGRTLEAIGWGRSDPELYEQIRSAMRDGEVWSGQLCSACSNGTLRTEEVTISPVLRGNRIDHYVQVRRDITSRLELEQQLREAQKLESVGRLSAGIAHEINTPSQYVNDNVLFLRDAFGEVLDLLSKLRTESKGRGSVESGFIHELLESNDIAYLESEIPSAIEQSLGGIGRITKIVRAMKEFSHQSQAKDAANLNQAIESTLTVAMNEWKYVADIDLDLDSDLPLVPCLLSEFNQVILNIVVNAAHAIADVVGTGGVDKGAITVTTRRIERWAEIRVADTGTGMSDDVKTRIFEPFFTTKEVGKGTGQGLSIAYNVIVKKHGGTIAVDSELGRGSCFVIRLPLEDSDGKTLAVA